MSEERSFLTLALASLLIISPVLADESPISKGLFLDLDANKGVETEGENRVVAWKNQVSGNAADVFTKQDEGRKEKGSGRPTLKKVVTEIGGGNTLVFEEQELVNQDEDAFDHLTKGSGYTWFSVMCVYKQNVGKKDVNSFFGNLRNGSPYDGFWANLMDDNRVWIGTRNGKDFGLKSAKEKKRPKKSALWHDELNPFVGTKEPVDEKRYYLIMGRMGAGVKTVSLELFINSTTPVDRQSVPVFADANPSKMAIGQERDATNHPGFESFHGEIARLMIYERPLSDEELTKVANFLKRLYEIQE